MNIPYWQRFLCGVLGAIAAVCFYTATRVEGREWLVYLGIALAIPLLPIVPAFNMLSRWCHEFVATYAAGVKARTEPSFMLEPPPVDAPAARPRKTNGVS